MQKSGVHWGAPTQLTRRGGVSGLPIILPEKVDGYIQAIRGKNTPSQIPVNESNVSFVDARNEKCESEVQISEETAVLEVEVDMLKWAGVPALGPISSS